MNKINNETLKSIAGRRSSRSFKPEQISDAELQAILTAGQQAPTGHNDQSCFFIVIQNNDLIKELSDGSKVEMQKSPIEWMANIGMSEKLNIYYNAPTVIIVVARKEAITPTEDVSASIENMMIAAESLNLASCWIGFAKYYFNSPERYQKVGIPDGYEMYYAVALGYKPDNFKSDPPARKYPEYFKIIK